ncbi:hypothetical protein ACFOEY_16000 [Paracandidimonas soli]|uniref:hypothetical protein n=1 Tax=Paracandidimonas soli TaxID=1917182 RepID=UPI00360FB48D
MLHCKCEQEIADLEAAALLKADSQPRGSAQSRVNLGVIQTLPASFFQLLHVKKQGTSHNPEKCKGCAE